jgi:hypothetical protein
MTTLLVLEEDVEESAANTEIDNHLCLSHRYKLSVLSSLLDERYQ